MSHPILAIYLKFKFKWASVFYLVAILGAGRGWAKLPGLRITRFRYFHFEKTEELISNCKIATLASRGWRQKMAQHPWSSGKCKSKPQGDTTSYPLRWLDLAILWNSAFRCLYLSFSPLLFASLLFTAICKASSDSHFAFLHFFSMGMVLIPVSCTMSWTSFHSSSGTLSDLCP